MSRCPTCLNCREILTSFSRPAYKPCPSCTPPPEKTMKTTITLAVSVSADGVLSLDHVATPDDPERALSTAQVALVLLAALAGVEKANPEAVVAARLAWGKNPPNPAAYDLHVKTCTKCRRVEKNARAKGLRATNLCSVGLLLRDGAQA